ncbi:MAG: cytochrome C [Deltaproteobacteria bacterium]|nr:cytochrome C [Deltaproteobacteria bacterium]
MQKSGMMKKERIRRFSTARIIEHLLIIVTTVTLFATGLSQRFWTFHVSKWFILKMGGIDNVRFIHRFAGLIFCIELILHLLIAVMGVTFKQWQPTMFITKKDFADAKHNMRYYFGFENHPARCDRFDYMEKFEYWTILTGGLLMILTGLILWFPALVARFLPGEIIPSAKALHSNEATLIFLLNAVWHIYNSIFSPDVFPLDTSIFTGHISRERMVREHPIELAQMEGVDIEKIVENNHRSAAGQEEAKPSPL